MPVDLSIGTIRELAIVCTTHSTPLAVIALRPCKDCLREQNNPVDEAYNNILAETGIPVMTFESNHEEVTS